jgi:hypothetical protein
LPEAVTFRAFGALNFRIESGGDQIKIQPFLIHLDIARGYDRFTAANQFRSPALAA